QRQPLGFRHVQRVEGARAEEQRERHRQQCLSKTHDGSSWKKSVPSYRHYCDGAGVRGANYGRRRSGFVWQRFLREELGRERLWPRCLSCGPYPFAAEAPPTNPCGTGRNAFRGLSRGPYPFAAEAVPTQSVSPCGAAVGFCRRGFSRDRFRANPYALYFFSRSASPAKALKVSLGPLSPPGVASAKYWLSV